MRMRERRKGEKKKGEKERKNLEWREWHFQKCTTKCTPLPMPTGTGLRMILKKSDYTRRMSNGSWAQIEPRLDKLERETI